MPWAWVGVEHHYEPGVAARELGDLHHARHVPGLRV